MIPFFLLLKFTGLLRATADEEALGLDSSHHGGSAYVGGDDDKSMTNGTHGTGASVTQVTTLSLHRCIVNSSWHSMQTCVTLLCAWVGGHLRLCRRAFRGWALSVCQEVVRGCVSVVF